MKLNRRLYSLFLVSLVCLILPSYVESKFASCDTCFSTPVNDDLNGVLWHPIIGKIIIINKSSKLFIQNEDGSDAEEYKLNKKVFKNARGACTGDLEAFPDLIYFAVNTQLLEFNITLLRETKGSDPKSLLPRRIFDGKDLSITQGGFDALAWAPNPEPKLDDNGNLIRGYFYAGVQDLGALHALNLPIFNPIDDSSSDTPIILTHSDRIQVNYCARIDLTGLDTFTWNNVTMLLATFDASDILAAVDFACNDIARWTMNGEGNLHQGSAFILKDAAYSEKYVGSCKQTTDDSPYLVIIEDGNNLIWRYTFPFDISFQENKVMFDGCKRPLAPIVDLFIFLDCLYLILVILASIQLYRLLKIDKKMRTKTVLHIMIVILAISRIVCCSVLAKYPFSKQLPPGIFILILILPFTLSYSCFSLLILLWAELVHFVVVKHEGIIPKKLKPMFAILNTVFLVSVGLHVGITGSLGDHPTRANAGVIVTVIFGIIYLIIVVGTSSAFIFYSTRLRALVKSLQDRATSEAAKKAKAEIDSMCMLGIACGVLLLITILITGAVGVVSTVSGSIGDFKIVVFPIFIISEFIPCLLLLYMFRKGGNAKDRRARKQQKSTTDSMTSASTVDETASYASNAESNSL